MQEVEDAPELSAALYKAFKCSVIQHNRRNELNTSQYRLFKQTDWALFGGKNEKREHSCIRGFETGESDRYPFRRISGSP